VAISWPRKRALGLYASFRDSFLEAVAQILAVLKQLLLHRLAGVVRTLLSGTDGRAVDFLQSISSHRLLPPFIVSGESWIDLF